MSSVLVAFPEPYFHNFAQEVLDRSDADALRQDWERVGEVFRYAIQKAEDEIQSGSGS
ncbi:MAG: hypothetical protein HUU29_06640 [Planctomycetaceae bacterium]|nr:hypothetical protein [Planctomycetaceae bacterium]